MKKVLTKKIEFVSIINGMRQPHALVLLIGWSQVRSIVNFSSLNIDDIIPPKSKGELKNESATTERK